MGLCVTAFSAGYGLSRLFKVDDVERVSLMYGPGMNNNGIGVVLASLVLAAYPRVMVPIIFYNLVQHLVAGGVHEVIGRNIEDQKATDS
jgi:BASS family bile acid:Na+ symporter